MKLIRIFEDQTPFNQRKCDNSHTKVYIETISYYTQTSGESAADEAFHCSNAPEEILSEAQKIIASYWKGRRSLSVGDIVEVDGISYRCESFGWKIV